MFISEFKSLPFSFYCTLKIAISTIVVHTFFGNYAVKAQIVPDNSLPNNSTIITNNNTVKINGGTIKGTNLFHSFTDFSLNPDNLADAIDTVHFNNANHITSIFSRVTGNLPSEINGLMKNNGSADLFLINPNGIIFGKNAALDIGGSFISSTADSIQFADDQEFSAVTPQANPVLTVNIPIGLQYGEQPQDIRVLGLGHQLDSNLDSASQILNRHNRPQELEVLTNQTIALIGGNIFLEGGNLTAPQGNVALGSVGKDQTVLLHPDPAGWKFDYAAVDDFGQINLSETASIEVSGNSAGQVWLQGESIALTAGSAILADTLGNGTPGLLSISAQDIEIRGFDSDLEFNSSLFANVASDAEGNGSNIMIESDSLSLMDGGQIQLNNYGLGDSGNLTIHTLETRIEGINSGLFSVVQPEAQGNGAHINLNTTKLSLQNKAQISLDTLGLGNGGDLEIKAQEMSLIDSGIYAHATTNIGNGGDMAISTDTLSLENGATIYAGNFIQPTDNSNSDVLTTLQISPSSLDYTIIGTGEVGKIAIQANIIELNSDSENTAASNISTATFAQGGGSIHLDANTVAVNHNSQISTDTKGDSHGGSIYLATDNLHLAQAGKISTNTLATGNAGKIIIEARNELIAEDEHSGIFSHGNLNASGNTGNIGIVSNTVNFRSGSQIDTTNSGMGLEGKITIEASQLYLAENELVTDISNNEQLGSNISLVGSEINPNQPFDTIEFTSITIDSTDLNISACISSPDSNLVINHTPSRLANNKAVASQNLTGVYQTSPSSNNGIVEANSWIINPEGIIELLAHSSCSQERLTLNRS